MLHFTQNADFFVNILIIVRKQGVRMHSLLLLLEHSLVCYSSALNLKLGPLCFLIIGRILSRCLGSLLCAIVWSLTQTRQRAESLAGGMTESLRESEQMQRDLAMQAERARS